MIQVFFSSDFTNWWRGWDRGLVSRSFKALAPIPGSVHQGIILSRKFEKRLTDYYFWNLKPVTKKLPFMCERDQKSSVGCYSDNGKDYRGRASRAGSGTECLFWNNTEVQRFLTADDKNFLGRDFETNYCRNPDNDKKPWCLTSTATGDIEYCDVPMCDQSGAAGRRMDQEEEGEESETCPEDYFQCSSQECILEFYKCDGKNDCRNGKDEDDCQEFQTDISAFSERRGRTLDIVPTESLVSLIDQIWCFNCP